MALKLAKKNNKVQKIVKKIQPATPIASKVVGQDKVTMPTGEYVEAVGRRKVATARVRLYESQGDFIVNDKIVGAYFRNIQNADSRYLIPFKITGTEKKFAVVVKVSGSGIAAQLQATIHGIARALAKYNQDFQPLLKQAGLLTRDDRMKETRKVGHGGKARRKRQSPKR
jgi:small subunit ribosomal protein S9